MKRDTFAKLMAFLEDLEQATISYMLARQRNDTLMVLVTVPGERWEVEFLADGSVEVEKFIGDGEIYD